MPKRPNPNKNPRRNYLHQLGIAVDQVLNALLAGHADETLSARSFRMQHRKKRWMMARKIIDTIFFWEKEHCYQAYLSERDRRHFPEYYQQFHYIDELDT